ncbi:MAG: hypothetical protein ACK4UJ_08265 [Leptonema sp. (in: bacteria)]
MCKRICLFLIFLILFSCKTIEKEEAFIENATDFPLWGSWTLDYEATIKELIKSDSLEEDRDDLNLYSLLLKKIQKEIKVANLIFERLNNESIWKLELEINSSKIKEQGTFDFLILDEKKNFSIVLKKQNQEDQIKVHLKDSQTIEIYPIPKENKKELTKAIFKKNSKKNEM